MSRTFWGVEVKPNETLDVPVRGVKLLHITNVALGEMNTNEKVLLKATVDDKEGVLGTLSRNFAPQIQSNLVFQHDIQLYHTWEHGSVYCMGFITDFSENGDDLESEPSEDEEVPDYLNLPGPFPARGVPMENDFLDHSVRING